MLRSPRLTFVSFLFLLLLIVPTNFVQAQASPTAQDNPSGAPGADIAVPDEVAQVVKFRESLTAEQISQIQAILDSHQAELQQLTTELGQLNATASNQANKVFLPLVDASGNAQSQASGNAQSQAKATELAVTPENAEKLSQVSQSTAALQAEIDQQILAVLTPAQSDMYTENAAKLQSRSQAIVARLETSASAVESPASSNDCFYGARYAAYSAYYAWYQYIWGYYDYVYNGNYYSYYAYLYGYYAEYYAREGLLYAGGAYYDVVYGFGYDSNGWSDTAYDNLVDAEYWSYYGYLNGFWSYYYYGESYGYNSYYNGWYANYYAYYAYYNEYYC